jgi:hypothetical protein
MPLGMQDRAMTEEKKKPWQKPVVRRVHLTPEERDRLFPHLHAASKVAAIAK